MPEPMIFESATTRFALPLLHVGQAQKEVFVNEALSLADTLMHCAVTGEASSPPGNFVEGEACLVSANATGLWEGQDGNVAISRGSGWTFLEPRDGMRIFDRVAGQDMLFFGYWRKASVPMEPLGGTSVDGEARVAINDLVSALKALGILPSA